jgi:hypothetical protein
MDSTNNHAGSAFGLDEYAYDVLTDRHQAEDHFSADNRIDTIKDAHPTVEL